MSERLDLVRLIDAKVRVAHVTAARSKTVAVLAEEDLADHRRWFEQQRQETEATLKKHASRLERQRAAEARREQRRKFAADVKSVGAVVHRDIISWLARVREGFIHIAEVLRTGLERSAALVRSSLSLSAALLWSGLAQSSTLLWSGLAGAGAMIRTLWPPLATALVSATSWLGVHTQAATIRVVGQVKRIGSGLWRWLSARGMAVLENVHQEVGRQIQGAHERRKQAAPASPRTRQWLQKRIHALDHVADVRLEPVLDEWQAFRARARKVQRDLELRQRDRRGGILWNGGGAFHAGTTLWRREPDLSMPQRPVVSSRARRRRPVTRPTPEPRR